MLSKWKIRAQQLQTELYALTLAYRDPRTPWIARLCAACVIGYAFSPIDLIPDPIPVLGLLDDLVILPLGIALALRLIPAPVMVECRIKAQEAGSRPRRVHWVAAGVIVILWILAVMLVLRLIAYLA
jgi:uncharacterized membrane protein YkvA (DUF1232 family)